MLSSNPKPSPSSDPAPEGPESESSTHVFHFSVWYRLFGYTIATLVALGLWRTWYEWGAVYEEEGLFIIAIVFGGVLCIFAGVSFIPSYRVTITDAWVEKRWHFGVGAWGLYEVVERVPWERAEKIHYSSATGIDPLKAGMVEGSRVKNGRTVRQTAAIMMGMSRRKEALRLLYQYAPEEVLENSPNFRNYIQRIGA
jgi:hypothetical protein